MVQVAVGASKSDNIARAVKLVTEAARKGAHIVTLPVRDSIGSLDGQGFNQFCVRWGFIKVFFIIQSGQFS